MLYKVIQTKLLQEPVLAQCGGGAVGAFSEVASLETFSTKSHDVHGVAAS